MGSNGFLLYLEWIPYLWSWPQLQHKVAVTCLQPHFVPPLPLRKVLATLSSFYCFPPTRLFLSMPGMPLSLSFPDWLLLILRSCHTCPHVSKDFSDTIPPSNHLFSTLTPVPSFTVPFLLSRAYNLWLFIHSFSLSITSLNSKFHECRVCFVLYP